MMKHFVVYRPNGEIARFGYCSDETFDLQAGEGEALLEAEFTGDQYVEGGALVDMPTKPVGDFVFDYATKTWVVDLIRATNKALALRDQLLRDGPDRISPLWWASMTATEQQAWTDYRQALLDISDQPGFPTNIIWPVSPKAP